MQFLALKSLNSVLMLGMGHCSGFVAALRGHRPIVVRNKYFDLLALIARPFVMRLAGILARPSVRIKSLGMSFVVLDTLGPLPSHAFALIKIYPHWQDSRRSSASHSQFENRTIFLIIFLRLFSRLFVMLASLPSFIRFSNLKLIFSGSI